MLILFRVLVICLHAMLEPVSSGEIPIHLINWIQVAHQLSVHLPAERGQVEFVF